jgi:hypothetical protein
MTFKLLGRNKDYLENKIKIMKAIGKVINMNFGLEKCARICLTAKVWSKAKNVQEANLRTLTLWHTQPPVRRSGPPMSCF